MNFKCLFVVTLLSFYIGQNALAQTSDSKSKYDLALVSVDSKSSVRVKESNISFAKKAENTSSYQLKTSISPNLYSSSSSSYYLPDDLAYRWYFQAGAGAQLLMAEDDDKSTFSSRITFAPAITAGYRWNPIFGVRLNVTGGSLHGYNDGHSGTYRFWKGKSEEFKINFAKENGFYDTYGLEAIERWDPRWNYNGWAVSGSDMFDPSSPEKQIYFNTHEGARGYHWILGNPGEGIYQGHFYMQHIRYIAANAAVTMNLFNLFGGVDETRKFDVSMHLGPTYFHVFPHQGVVAYDGFG